MKKTTKNIIIVLLFFLGSLNVLAQDKGNDSFMKKNSFRLGLNYMMNGTGDEISLMYQNEYQRKLNKYFELGFGVGFSNYIKSIDTWAYKPEEVYNSTSIVSMDLLVNLLVMDFERHFFKIGAGYSFRKVKQISWYSMVYIKDHTGQDVAIVSFNKTDGFDSGVIVNLEYGFRISPRFATSVSGRYYSEGKYVSLAMAGINFYYSF